MSKAREALEWFLNLAGGVGKSGDAIKPGEFEAAIAFARETLADQLTPKDEIRGTGLPGDVKRKVTLYLTERGEVWFEYDPCAGPRGPEEKKRGDPGGSP